MADLFMAGFRRRHRQLRLGFRPRLLRGGRNVIYAAVEADQDGRMTHHATGTYGIDGTTPPLSPTSRERSGSRT